MVIYLDFPTHEQNGGWGRLHEILSVVEVRIFLELTLVKRYIAFYLIKLWQNKITHVRTCKIARFLKDLRVSTKFHALTPQPLPSQFCMGKCLVSEDSQVHVMSTRVVWHHFESGFIFGVSGRFCYSWPISQGLWWFLSTNAYFW